MSQVSKVMRRAERGYLIWCPACEEMHLLPDGWGFDGNLERPSFQPSFKISWDGVKDGREVSTVCHFVLTAGVMNFVADCTHGMKDRAVPLPDLPAAAQDGGS